MSWNIQPTVQLGIAQKPYNLPLKIRQDIEVYIMYELPPYKMPSRIKFVEGLHGIKVYVPKKYHKKHGNYLRCILDALTIREVKVEVNPLMQSMKQGKFIWETNF